MYYQNSYDDDEPITFGVYLIDSSAKGKTQPYDEITFEPYEDFTYENLIEKLKICFPVLNDWDDNDYFLTFFDEYNSFQAVDNDDDLNNAVDDLENNEYNLYVVYNDDIIGSSGDLLQSQFFCNFCCFALKSCRYKCTVCPDYDLCFKCNEEGIHNFHDFKYLDITPLEESPDLDIRQVSYNDFYDKRKIGEGCFGEVHSAYSNTFKQKVAVKYLKNFYEEKNFLKEMAVLQQLREHENVVKILGFVNQGSEKGIVMEHITVNRIGREISGLSTYLTYLRYYRKQGGNIDVDELQSFALQIARGMEHLEFNHILHRDLATRNVLIDENKNVKICDFGLSRLGDYYQANNIFALRWAAPEVLRQDSYSHKSDVWAFGVVLWEIATLGALPYGHMSNVEVFNFVCNSGHLYKPENVSGKLFDIMVRCWTVKPKNRPNFSALVEKLLDFKWIGSGYLQFEEMSANFQLPDGVELYEKRLRGW